MSCWWSLCKFMRGEVDDEPFGKSSRLFMEVHRGPGCRGRMKEWIERLRLYLARTWM